MHIFLQIIIGMTNNIVTSSPCHQNDTFSRKEVKEMAKSISDSVKRVMDSQLGGLVFVASPKGTTSNDKR